MTDSELFSFIAIWNDLLRLFPKRLEEDEKSRLHRDYFKAMRRFSLGQIELGAEAWMQRGKFFPKPAEWIDAIPTQRTTSADVPAMTEQESREYRRAESLKYEDTPCHCRECERAGVAEKALRFVPDVSADGSDRKLRDGERIVTAGHWAHGLELAGYYRARADFYEAFVARFGRAGM